MARPRSKKFSHLPPGMHQKGKALYLIDHGKWIPLGSDLTEALAKYSGKVPIAVEPGRLFRDLVAQYLRTEFLKLKPTTRSTYTFAITNLLKSFGDAPVREITAAAIGRYMDLRSSIHSANTEKAVLSKILKLGVRWGWVEENVATRVSYHPTTRRRRIITKAEWSAIRLAASDDLIPVFMDLAYMTGLRISDVLALKWSQLTDDGLYVLQGKNNVEGYYERTPAFEDVLARAARLHGRDNRVRSLTTPNLHIIHKRDLSPYTYYGFRSIWRMTVARAFKDKPDPKPRITIHDIRRTAITAAKLSGIRPIEFSLHRTEKEANAYVIETPKVRPLEPMK